MGKSTLHVAPHHPTAAGHFPGNPILPGALLLAEVVRLIELERGHHFASYNVKAAKFFHPVRPGDAVEIAFAVSPREEISFQCTVGETKVLSGTIDAAVRA